MLHIYDLFNHIKNTDIILIIVDEIKRIFFFIEKKKIYEAGITHALVGHLKIKWKDTYGAKRWCRKTMVTSIPLYMTSQADTQVAYGAIARVWMIATYNLGFLLFQFLFSI